MNNRKKPRPLSSSSVNGAAKGITKYGRFWDSATELDVEFEMFKGTWDPEHFWNIAGILFPPGGPRPFDRNPWAEKIVEEALKHKMLSISGAASSGKSDTAAVLAIICWLADPLKTLIMVTSTSLKESRRRIWGAIEDYWNALPDDVRMIGKLVSSSGLIKINPLVRKASERASIVLIPGEKKKEKEAVGKIIGAKNFRVILICDEMPELSPALLNAAVTNLKSNPNFHLWGLGNPASYYDAHGIFSKPKAGWETITIESYEWATDYGWAIRFDAEKSPNLIHDPHGEEAPWPYLPTLERLTEAREKLGENSFGYYRQWRGFWFADGVEQTVFSAADLLFHGAHRDEIEWLDIPVPVAGLDAGYTAGGDRSIAYFGLCGREAKTGAHVLLATEHVLLRDNPLIKDVPRSHQIARAYKAECEKRGVPGYLRGVDVTGAPSFGDIVVVEVSAEALKVNFSGKSSKRTTGMDNVPANTRYSTSGTELWFSAKEMLQTRQLIGLVPDVCAELIERRYIVNGDVVRLEEKKDMKKRTGESPDLADALLVMCAVARDRAKLKVDRARAFVNKAEAPGNRQKQSWKKFRENRKPSFRTAALRREGMGAKSRFGRSMTFVR